MPIATAFTNTFVSNKSSKGSRKATSLQEETMSRRMISFDGYTGVEQLYQRLATLREELSKAEVDFLANVSQCEFHWSELANVERLRRLVRETERRALRFAAAEHIVAVDSASSPSSPRRRRRASSCTLNDASSQTLLEIASTVDRDASTLHRSSSWSARQLPVHGRRRSGAVSLSGTTAPPTPTQ